MKIEAGKSYKTAEGRKVGPMTRSVQSAFPWTDGDATWDDDGAHCGAGSCPDKIISEWTEGPVRTVTRKEIVPGVYDRVHVGNADSAQVIVTLGGFGMGMQQQSFTSAELRAAAAVLIELAEALE